MNSNRDQHHPVTCPHCESVPPTQFRHHWKHEAKAGYWHTIAVGPDLLRRLPRQAHFLTILSYQPAPDGSPAHYRGPLYGECDATDPAQAFTDLQRCIELLHAEYDCPMEAIRLWHSGHRGPHWTIPPVVSGAEAGHPQLPRVYAAMIATVFPASVAPTFDRSIYSLGKGRMWRLPNRRRSDTNCYKVPPAISEVLHKSYADLEALTHQPRKGIFWPSEDDLSPCPGLVELYRETTAAMAALDHQKIAAAVPEDQRLAEGHRNAALTSWAGTMRRRGMSQDAIFAALLVENRLRCDPPLDEAEVQRIAESVARYSPASTPSWRPFRTILATEVTSWRR
jgi:Primase C terminal 1 (PriCT-1)